VISIPETLQLQKRTWRSGLEESIEDYNRVDPQYSNTWKWHYENRTAITKKLRTDENSVYLLQLRWDSVVLINKSVKIKRKDDNLDKFLKWILSLALHEEKNW